LADALTGPTMITFDNLVRLLEGVFLANGAAQARLLVLNCASCERDGALTQKNLRTVQ
jgi:hypothetical protein